MANLFQIFLLGAIILGTTTALQTRKKFHLCKEPVKAFRGCTDFDSTDYKTIAKEKGTGHSLKKVVPGYGEGFVIPSGCKVTLYSTSSELAQLGSHPDSHALIIAGPSSTCASKLLKGGVKAVGIVS